MRLLPLLLIAPTLLFPASANAQEFKGLVNVNPINNYRKNFNESFDRVLAATNYIDRWDGDYEDAIMRELASIQVDKCEKTTSRDRRKKCISRLEYLGNSLERYLGI